MVLVLLGVLLDLATSTPSLPSAEALRGPFPSLAAACRSLRHSYQPPLNGAQCAFVRQDACGGLRRAQRIGPFDSLQFLRVLNQCHIALREARGWWIGETSLGISDRHLSNVDGIETDSSRVVVRIANRYWWHENGPDYQSWYDLRSGLFVCGLADGIPACTRELVVGWAPRWEDESGEVAPHRWRWRYDARFDRDALVVTKLGVDGRTRPLPALSWPTAPPLGRLALPF